MNKLWMVIFSFFVMMNYSTAYSMNLECSEPIRFHKVNPECGENINDCLNVADVFSGYHNLGLQEADVVNISAALSISSDWISNTYVKKNNLSDGTLVLRDVAILINDLGRQEVIDFYSSKIGDTYLLHDCSDYVSSVTILDTIDRHFEFTIIDEN